MNIYPTELRRVGRDELLIIWSDGQARQYSPSELRAACPCASCRELHGPVESPPADLLPILSGGTGPALTIAGMRPVGSYAYSIHFSDGHETGIYTFEHLLELGRPTREA